MKLILLCHGATAAMRGGAFPAVDDPLDDGSMRKLTAVRLASSPAVCSPTRASRETAAALGLVASVVPALGDLDNGAWSGRSFEAVQDESSDAFFRWLDMPWEGTPGGETFAVARDRVATWMATIVEELPMLIAVVPPMIVRAALCAAIDLPASASMRIDVAPLTTATLSLNRGWRLQQLGAVIPG